MRLPEQFVARMQDLLKDEWGLMLNSWQEPHHLGLRVNTLKVSVEEFLTCAPFDMEPIPWTTDGFYYRQGDRPGKHPYYQAGLYYLQEPSAMAPAACLGVVPGERVLDLCAAPGGKSTQLAACLQGQGVLVSNDVSSERVKALVWNLEHWGAVNAVVVNETPDRLAGHFPEFFDKILVDAPCSGEGMFRKDPRAVKSWSAYGTETCTLLQNEILEQAASMLKKGGRMVYSTCTFAPQENEAIIANFLEKHQEFRLLPLPETYGWAPGLTTWPGGPQTPATGLENTRRLWPHKVRGEGHFLALLERKAGQTIEPRNDLHTISPRDVKNEALDTFMAENLAAPLAGPFYQQGTYIYRVPHELPAFNGIKTARPGWFIGLLKNGRFEPAQALAMGLKPRDVRRQRHLSLEDETTERYLKGETLLLEGEPGWTLVCLEDWPLGWAKQTKDNLKNYYPPGWRLLE